MTQSRASLNFIPFLLIWQLYQEEDQQQADAEDGDTANCEVTKSESFKKFIFHAVRPLNFDAGHLPEWFNYSKTEAGGAVLKIVAQPGREPFGDDAVCYAVEAVQAPIEHIIEQAAAFSVNPVEIQVDCPHFRRINTREQQKGKGHGREKQQLGLANDMSVSIRVIFDSIGQEVI